MMASPSSLRERISIIQGTTLVDPGSESKYTSVDSLLRIQLCSASIDEVKCEIRPNIACESICSKQSDDSTLHFLMMYGLYFIALWVALPFCTF
ncbi:hypothetical protein RIF29_25178 [Crotalaria pallida]|uniref:Uncharacterized protein n=1 Tax=Crotalaria pallida TaxID=3830 RepID=A0AAN9HZJ8_CROPI